MSNRTICVAILAGLWLAASAVEGLQPSTFWNPLRFLQQSSRFVKIPGSAASAGASTTVKVRPGDVLFQSDGSITNEFDFAPLGKNPFEFVPVATLQILRMSHND